MATLADRLPSRRELTVVRALRVGDLGRFHEYRAAEALARFQGWTPMTVEQALIFLQATSAVTDLIAGDWIQLGVADAVTDLLIGDLGLFLAQDGLSAEVGFTLNQQSQGQGHATRAVLTAIDLVLASTSAAEVRAVTDARNVASIRVLDRAGFQFTLQQQAVFKGEACTELVYVYRRSDH